jgi:hypothetical protein
MLKQASIIQGWLDEAFKEGEARGKARFASGEARGEATRAQEILIALLRRLGRTAICAKPARCISKAFSSTGSCEMCAR